MSDQGSTKLDVAPHVIQTQHEISQRNATISPLLRLPAELRNMIWTFALDCGQDVQLLREAELRFPEGFRNCINLIFVCRQLHAETNVMFYEINTFSMLTAKRSFLVKFLEKRTITQREVMMNVKWVWYRASMPEIHTAMEWLRMGRVRRDSW
ncbi:hypothetical protein G6011_07614 [Alternaria panax]|uniref:Uncharacterized protein n=1 Tax=Alternaria panax TaxID=48097 RepID=A0AAD4I9J1_9PLEO|nr:hypothetical protein G6011_07614 [Alternaria panax]